MLTLHQYIPNPHVPDPSAFCSKVELFLKINKLPYAGQKAQPNRMPKGKLPVIKDEATLIADSENIIRYLCFKHNIDPEEGLTPEQKAVSFMIRKTMEEYYYFIMLHSRWAEPDGFEVCRGLFFSDLPKPLRTIVPNVVRRQVLSSIKAQGIGRHDKHEIDVRARETLDHLAQFIGKHDFIFGDRPTLADCVVFPFLWGAFHFPSDSELKKSALQYPAFRTYVDRILTSYYN